MNPNDYALYVQSEHGGWKLIACGQLSTVYRWYNFALGSGYLTMICPATMEVVHAPC